MSRTRAVLTAIVLLSALAFVGCNDDDPEPKFDPTPSSEAPTSPSTTAAALGPEDTVRAWVEAQNEALSTGNVSGMEALAAPGCRGCADFSEPIRKVIEAGGEYIGGTWAVAAAKARKPVGSEIRVDVAMSMAKGKTVPRTGADPVPFAEDNRIMLFRLAPDGDALKLTFVGFVE